MEILSIYRWHYFRFLTNLSRLFFSKYETNNKDTINLLSRMALQQLAVASYSHSFLNEFDLINFTWVILMLNASSRRYTQVELKYSFMFKPILISSIAMFISRIDIRLHPDGYKDFLTAPNLIPLSE